MSFGQDIFTPQGTSKASEFLDSYLIGQVTPKVFLDVVRPSELPYIKTPDRIEIENRIMERVVPNQSVENLQLLLSQQPQQQPTVENPWTQEQFRQYMLERRGGQPAGMPAPQPGPMSPSLPSFVRGV